MLYFVKIDPETRHYFGKYRLDKETLIVISGGLFKISLILVLVIFLISYSYTRSVINKSILRIPSLFFFLSASFKSQIKNRLCEPMVSFVENFAKGFTLIKHPQVLCVCIGFSIIIWTLLALSYYLMALGSPGILLSFTEMFAVMIIICFFIALPSVPGYWGIWEAGGVFALSVFAISAKEAAGFTLANHVIQVLPVVIVGMVSAFITGVNIFQISHRKNHKITY